MGQPSERFPYSIVKECLSLLFVGADWLKFDMGQVYVMIAFSIFPVIVVYLLLSRYIVGGVTLGGVKG